MKCTTIRKDSECIFMAKTGCTYEGGVCKPIIESCNECSRIVEVETGQYCSVAPDPSSKWRLGMCNLATHVKIEIVETKQKLNPLKASKRGKH